MATSAQPHPGSTVRLLRPWAGMATGAEGVLIGWYVHADPMALVRFWDGGPLQVPAAAVVGVEDDPERAAEQAVVRTAAG